MTPKRFLAAASVALLRLGTLGVTGRLGSISRASFFNPPHWINWLHLLLAGSSSPCVGRIPARPRRRRRWLRPLWARASAWQDCCWDRRLQSGSTGRN